MTNASHPTTTQRITGLIEAGYEDVARATYGDQTVDHWFRDVDGVDPDAMREGW